MAISSGIYTIFRQTQIVQSVIWMTLDNFGTWTWSIMEHCDTEVFADEYFAQVSFLCWRGQSLKPRRRVVSSHFDHHWSQNKSHRMSKECLETKFHHVSSLCIFFHHMSTLFDNLFPPCLFNVSPCWSMLHQFLTIFPRISPFLIMFPWFFLGLSHGLMMFDIHSFVQQFSRSQLTQLCFFWWKSRPWFRSTFPAFQSRWTWMSRFCH